MHELRVVYDITQRSSGAVVPLVVGGLFLGLGGLFILRVRREGAPWNYKFFAGALPFFGIIAMLAGSHVRRQHERCQELLESGRVEVIEGEVQGFRPMPPSGHASESFSVAGQRFEYSPGLARCGFNQTASHGGPIREGLYVRITHHDGQILRLECDDAAPAP